MCCLCSNLKEMVVGLRGALVGYVACIDLSQVLVEQFVQLLLLLLVLFNKLHEIRRGQARIRVPCQRVPWGEQTL